MDKVQITPKLDNVIRKIQTILRNYILLEKKYLKAVADNKNLKNQLDGYESQVRQLKEQTKILKLTKGVNLSDKDNSEVKESINEFIKEIDKCIAMLNN